MAAAPCFSDPDVDDVSIRRDEEMVAFLTRSTMDHAPPRRFLAGADAIGLAEQKIAKLREDIESHPDLSSSLALDELSRIGGDR